MEIMSLVLMGIPTHNLGRAISLADLTAGEAFVGFHGGNSVEDYDYCGGRCGSSVRLEKVIDSLNWPRADRYTRAGWARDIDRAIEALDPKPLEKYEDFDMPAPVQHRTKCKCAGCRPRQTGKAAHKARKAWGKRAA